MASLRISPAKLLLIAAAVAAAGTTRFVLAPRPAVAEMTSALPEANAIPGKVSRPAADTGTPDTSSGRERAELAPPGPGFTTKVSNRSAALASSSAGPARPQEPQQAEEMPPSPEEAASSMPARGSSAATARADGHSAAPAFSTATGPALSSPPPSGKASAEAARIAQSAAAMPLVHSVTDDQVKQAAPNVPQDVLDQVRDQFDQSVTAGQLDPGDPQYAHDWDSASRAAADRMRALYGWGAYAAMQRQAALAAATGQTGQ